MKFPALLLLFILGTFCEAYGSKKIFCYYSSFAQTRPGIGKFLPEDIDPYLCTHVIYAFVDISKDGQDLVAFNWNDRGENGLYARTLALKEKNSDLKILLAVGGWMIGSKPFIPMVRSETNRRIWIENVIEYLRRYKFDGFDMDWEFPGTRGSPPEDKYRFTALMKELYTAFAIETKKTGQEKLLLTLATAAGSHYIGLAYEPHEIIKYVDYMLLMTYNYHGQWEKITGHHSGMWKHENDAPGEKSELHTEWSINYWLRIGIPKSKLIAGIATYGMSFTLESSSNHGLFAPAQRGGHMGKYTSETGILSYYEVCDNIRNHGWKTKWIDQQEVPYAYGGDQWVGYENVDSIRIKAKNIIKRDLAGAFVWSLEMDDFSGSCGEGKSPLMSTVHDILKPYGYNGPRRVWGPKSSIVKIDVTSPRREKEYFGKSKPTWKPLPSYRPKWNPRGNSQQRVSTKPKVTVKAKPAWREKTTWKPRPTWARYTWAPWDHNKKQVTTKKPVRKVKPTKQPSAAGSIDCSKVGLGIFADPASCVHFIMCLSGGQQTYRPIRMDCPKGTRFDQDLSICNHAKNVECW